MRRRLVLSVPLLAALLLVSRPFAHGITEERGALALQLLLRKLAVAGTVMHVTAHPDDENNALLAKQSQGQGLRVILATATRGNGGQNEIGPELFEALGVLRTEELLAAHRFDGAEQMFARAIDFGYSFSVQESFDRWGKDEILGDYVRLIRMTRPDVMITMRPDLPGGGQHHQASALIGLEAFRAAADPGRYPEQLKQGLRPWQPLKIYKVGYYGFFSGEPKPPEGTRLVPVEADVYDPLLGRTYAEIGSEARAMHKCQGFGQLLALPGSWVVRYQLADTVIAGQKDKDEKDLLDGVDISLTGLARFAGPNPPGRLTAGLQEVATAIREADEASRRSGPEAASPALARGLAATTRLHGWVRDAMPEPARYEIAHRLVRTGKLFGDAIATAHALRVEALADDDVVTPGQDIKVQLIVANRGSEAVTLEKAGFDGFAPATLTCPGSREIPAGGVLKCEQPLTIPADARITEPYWHRDGSAERYEFDPDAPFGQPFRPTPFVARLSLLGGSTGFAIALPVQRRYEGNIFSGEKRTELLVVPSFSTRVFPEIAIVPTHGAGGTNGDGTTEREVRVMVTSNSPGSHEAQVELAVPNGWISDPASATVRFARPDESAAVRFRLRPPSSVSAGTYVIAAKVTEGTKTWPRGYDVVEYPHTRRQHIYSPAVSRIKALDVRLPPGLVVGYVMGVGDQVAQAVEQLGATVHFISEDELASGDLSRFDVIVTGVRAYERRKDLRAYNHRLLEYARNGGTVLVQYNKFEFNQAQYGPLPAKVSSSRVTDETSPVKVLQPSHPVFTTPNAITDDTWRGWVQERGLYFLGERDPQYVDLVELSDPFPDNAGSKRGALVEARVGKGRWVYIGLGLWRQLPAGTEGAYRLLANLLALGGRQTP